MIFSVLFSNRPLEESADDSDFVEEHQHETGFAAYFDQNVRPMRADMEARRMDFLRTIRRRFRKSAIWGGPWLLLWGGNMIAGFMGVEPCASILDWFDLMIYIAIMVIPIVLLEAWTFMPMSEYKAAVKDEVFTSIVQFFGQDWSYRSKGGFDESMLQCSDIKPSYDRFSDEDCFSGTYKDVKISLAEVRLFYTTRDSEGRERESLRFSGLCLSFSVNKRFQGKTVAVGDKGGGWFRGNKKKLGDMERVELEDPEFEKKFEVYGTDQIEARYLLTTAFMDRTLNLSAFLAEAGSSGSLEFEFWDANLFMMLPSSQDFFEPGSVFEPAMQIEDIRKFLKEMSLIFEIVDALKLNLDIGL